LQTAVYPGVPVDWQLYLSRIFSVDWIIEPGHRIGISTSRCRGGA